MKKMKMKVKSRVATKSKISVGHKIALFMLVGAAFSLGLNFAGMAFNLPQGLNKPKNISITRPQPLVIDSILAYANVRFESPDGAEALITRKDEELGFLDLNSNSFQHNGLIPDVGAKAPLALSLTHLEEGIKTFPSRIINVRGYTRDNYVPIYNGYSDWNIDDPNQVSYNLCVPESRVFNQELNNPVVYYYDTNGTPYHDKFLTDMATSKACNKILANALDVETAITNAEVNLPVNYYTDTITNIETSVMFFKNFFDPGDNGELNLSDNYFYANSYNPYPRTGAPLAIELNQWGGVEPIVVPARILSIALEDENTQKRLCVPESLVMDREFGEAPYKSVIYFYDNNGTPYYDSFLTEMATPKACDQLLANSLSFNFITHAAVNVPVQNIGDPGGYSMYNNMYLDFKAYFGSTYDRLGELNLTDNDFYNGWSAPQPVVAPLAISLYHNSNFPETMPARIVSVENADLGNYRLCVPETIVSNGEYLSGSDEQMIYFYDRNGTPYYDSLLINKVTSKSCTDLLANALNISQIIEAKVNFPVYSVDNAELIFKAYFGSTYDRLGELNLTDNYFYNGGWSAPQTVVAPLAISLNQWSAPESSTALVPSRIVFITDQDNNNYTICTPEAIVASGEYSLPIYFYDNNGTPYYDSFLTDRAISRPCNELLANALDIDYITNANIARNNLVESPDMAEITFVINGGSRGSLNLNDNYFQSNYSGWGMNDLINNPLAIILNHGEEGAQIMPTRNIIVESDNESYNLCVPASRVEGWDSNEITYYFYDNNGNPYSDSLLAHPIACPPVNTRYNFEEALPN